MILELSNVSKSYRGKPAVDGVSLSLQPGDYFGVLGPNGAGKSTLMAMLIGLLDPEPGGVIRLFGQPVRAATAHRVRGRVGVVGEAPQLQDGRTVWSYLSFFGRLYSVDRPEERIEERLRETGILDAADKPIRALSRGMKQRLSLARALLHDPELLILDEPTGGLDPRGVHDVRALLQRENERGRTIFLCSHLLSEVERSCRRVAVIHKGRIRASGGTEEVARGDLEKSFLELTGEV